MLISMMDSWDDGPLCEPNACDGLLGGLGECFLVSGVYPTNSRNCTCQQSSVSCRDQCVRMIGSMQNMSAGMHEFHSIALVLIYNSGQWLAECSLGKALHVPLLVCIYSLN
jgi:hypothetical protein